LCIYHSGPLVNSDASLIEKLKAITSTADSGPQQPPNGYAMMGWHVDDSTGLACDANRQLDYAKNRVVLYVQGTIQVVYATTMTGWHGNKALGFLLECCAVEKRVTLSAPDMIDQVGDALLKDCVVITPKHIMTEDFDDIPAGVVPAVDDPMYKSVLADNAMCRHAIGVYTYASIAYPHLVMPNSVLGKNAAYPHCRTLKGLRHMAMHLRANKRSASYCTYGVVGLERSADDELIAPHGVRRPVYLHAFVDANLKSYSRTGGVAMLACGTIHTVSQNQHLASPCSHTSEVVAASTFFNHLVPTIGSLQELGIMQGVACPYYLDSKTTVFVANDDKGVKKSVWLIRRTAVLRDGVVGGHINPLYLSERDNCADPFTKYLPVAVWLRHMLYLLNARIEA
jgi:hypothetical protein